MQWHTQAQQTRRGAEVTHEAPHCSVCMCGCCDNIAFASTDALTNHLPLAFLPSSKNKMHWPLSCVSSRTSPPLRNPTAFSSPSGFSCFSRSASSVMHRCRRRIGIRALSSITTRTTSSRLGKGPIGDSQAAVGRHNKVAVGSSEKTCVAVRPRHILAPIVPHVSRCLNTIFLVYCMPGIGSVTVIYRAATC